MAWTTSSRSRVTPLPAAQSRTCATARGASFTQSRHEAPFRGNHVVGGWPEGLRLLGRQVPAGGELHQVGPLDAEQQAGGCVQGHDPAVVHDGDPVAQGLGLLYVVGREDDGLSVGVDQADELPQVAPGLGVQPGGGLVEDDHLGVVHEAGRHREPLLLPSGELLQGGLGPVGQAHRVQQLVRREAPGVERAEEGQDFVKGQVVEVGRGLELDPDAPLDLEGVPAGVHPQDPRLSLGGRLQPLDYLQSRGLPGAVGPQDAEHLAPPHRERDAVHGGEGAVTLDQPPHLDHLVHGARIIAQGPRLT